ncbi:MAG TPA: helix-turn-helix transcriptional regulator [Actinospica sp.]|nr:helix-turn-helix transcriptional regulator [Actinospica sp.]
MTDLHLGPVRLTQLGAYIREQRENAQYSLRQLASVSGVSNPYLSQIERGLRKPSADVLQQLAKALQISAETLYVRAGLLDGEQGAAAEDSEPHGPANSQAERTGVLAAIAADPHLTPRQKNALREIYLSLRGQEGSD